VNHVHGLNFFHHQTTMDEVARGHMRVSMLYRFYTGAIPLRWDMEGARFADLTVVQNKHDEDYLLEQECENVMCIPLAVHPEILAAGENSPKQAARDPMSLFWSGSWMPSKGSHYLPRAFERICERFPQAQLTIGGTGRPPQEIAGYFKEPLRGRIRVISKTTVEQQIREFSENAIFLFPSISEGFGFAPLEALAMRMAVVTTHAGFGGDLLVDWQHARVIPTASALHLADAVIELMEHPELRDRMAEQGRKLAETLTFERMITAYEQAFDEALQHRTRNLNRENLLHMQV
jgi:glycosyltransferase involved in cell wall biosynthesis